MSLQPLHGLFVRFGGGFGWGGLGVAAGWLGRRGIFFRRLFVAFAAVVGDIKAAAFEQQTGAGADFLLPGRGPIFFARKDPSGQIFNGLADMD